MRTATIIESIKELASDKRNTVTEIDILSQAADRLEALYNSNLHLLDVVKTITKEQEKQVNEPA